MKQMEVTVKKIGSTKFYITPFPAFTAARVSGLLSEVLAPMLGELSPMFDGMEIDASNGGNIDTGDIMDMDIGQLIPALAGALGKLDGDKFEKLAMQLLVDYKNVSYQTESGETERLDYDAANEIFCGDMMGMIQLGFEVVKVNFGGFFKKLAPQSGSLQEFTANLTAKSGGTKNGESLT